MFGISLAELIVALLLFVFFIKPEDIPQIARFLGKIYSKVKKTLNFARQSIESTKKDIGFDQIKQEFNIAIDEEESKSDKKGKKTTKIVDIYGKTHYVMDISSIRPDLSEEEVEQEIDQLNQKNKKN